MNLNIKKIPGATLSKDEKDFIFDHLSLKRSDCPSHEGLSIIQKILFDGNLNSYIFFIVNVEEKDHPIAVGLLRVDDHIGAPGCYTMQIYVRSEFRRKGIGKTLITEMRFEAMKKYGIFKFQVGKWDKRSTAFYTSVGI